VKLFVGLAVVACDAAPNGAPPSARLNDEGAIDAALQAGVVAGGFSELHRATVRFSPHGVTGASIVGESHLAIHTWPEEARAFVDVASCSSRESVARAMDAIADALAPCRVVVLDVRELDEHGARPAR
jgi:S-adenosylmethionine decarboxylase